MIKRNNIFKLLLFSFSFILGSLLLSSCSDEDPDSPGKKDPQEEFPKQTSILIYAIASNNLSYNLDSDKYEILSCAKALDLNNCALYIYEVTPAYEPALLRLKQTEEGIFDFVNVKDYSSEVSSADPERMSEVIYDFKNLSPSSNYGLILWSHGTGVDYYQNPTRSETESLSSSGVITSTMQPDGSFGYDQNPQTGEIHQMNIDDLAQALPDNGFDFIWFDACYMNSIETAYQLRNKTTYMVGYPTEVYVWGMPYEEVIPIILQPEPDLIQGADAFFNFYSTHISNSARVATVGVLDLRKIQRVAGLCKQAYAGGGGVNKAYLQQYSRKTIGPFYDLNGYTLRMAEQNSLDSSWMAEWDEAMNQFVVYKNSTPLDFNFNSIDLEQFCSINCYIPNLTNPTAKDTYYQSLEWFEATYPSGSQTNQQE